MANFEIPAGFIKDENTGLYYSQTIDTDASGRQVQNVTWFNSETGEYNNVVYPIAGPAVQPTAKAAQQTAKTAPIKTNLGTGAAPTAKKKSKAPAIIGAIVALAALGVAAYFFLPGLLDKKNTGESETASLGDSPQIIDSTIKSDSGSSKNNSSDINTEKNTSNGGRNQSSDKSSTSEIATDSVAEEVVTDEYDYSMEEAEKAGLDYAAGSSGNSGKSSGDGTYTPSGTKSPTGEDISYLFCDFKLYAETEEEQMLYGMELSTISLHTDGTYEMFCQAAGDYWGFKGTYTVKGPDSSNKTYVYLQDAIDGAGNVQTAILVFPDRDKYPVFQNDGFGYMGSQPYCFDGYSY